LITQTQAGQTSYYLVDGLGSTRLLTDTQGQVLNAYGYEAFGETVSQSGTASNKYQYAGEQFDTALGDYYLRQRFYDTSGGRFGRMDTLEGDLNNPTSLNKYIYANNNPTSYTDPTGYISSLQEYAVVSAVVTTLAAIGAEFGGAAMGMPVISASFNTALAAWIPIASPESFTSYEEAAIAVLKKINPKSRRENLEYGGLIVEKNGKFHYTGPFRGTRASVYSGKAPQGYKASANYHTHGGAANTLFENVQLFFNPNADVNGFGNERFSPTDRTSIDNDEKTPGFLGTPAGRVIRYDPGDINNPALNPLDQLGRYIRPPGTV
jgi:RHS repeat-associated protein